MSESSMLSACNGAVSQANFRSQEFRPGGESFRFEPQCGKSGRVNAATGAILAATGLFLLCQMESTHGLAIQLAIVGAVCSVGGAALVVLSIRDLFGSLKVDEAGITVLPKIAGFAISWNELARWEVHPVAGRYPDANSFLLWTADEPCALSIPNTWLSDQDRVEVARCLRTFVPEKEVSKSR